jgi:Ti-type conjugative transfer relaxase TraA
MKMALGALFRAELSKQLLGVGLTPYRPSKPNRENEKVSWFEVFGVPKTLIAEFSKRRREIQSWLNERGLSGSKNAEKAALRTRQVKGVFDVSKLFRAWRKVAASHEVTAETIRFEMASQQEAADQRSVETLVSGSLEQITDHYAQFKKTELIRKVAENSQTTVHGIDAVLASVEKALQTDRNVLRLKHRKGQQQYTTKKMLQLEHHLLETANQLVRQQNHQVSQSKLDRVLKQYPTLNREQLGATRFILESGDICCVNGVAGSGKTYMLSVVRDACLTSGFEVFGTALAAKAAQGLQEGSGIHSTHIHDLLYKLDKGELSLNDKSVLVVDEAGMVGTKMMGKLATIVAESGAKLVLVGDHRQLQAISAGSPFRVIAERQGCFEINTIRRQRQEWARESVIQFRDGKAEAALAEYQRRGLIHVADSRTAAIEKLVDDWLLGYSSNSPDSLIFAGTNYEVSMINSVCQKARNDIGQLGKEYLDVDGQLFFRRDRVVVTRNLRSAGIRNGSFGTVVETDRNSNSIKIRFDEGFTVWIDTTEFADFQLGYAVSTHKGQGQTVENAFVLAGGSMTDRELTYVQASRAKGDTKIYTDRESTDETLVSLAASMNQSRAKSMAVEQVREIA